MVREKQDYNNIVLFSDLADQMISNSTPEIDTQTEITSESTSFENEVGLISWHIQVYLLLWNFYH